jgi:hypothetical protein
MMDAKGKFNVFKLDFSSTLISNILNKLTLGYSLTETQQAMCMKYVQIQFQPYLFQLILSSADLISIWTNDQSDVLRLLTVFFIY